MRRVRFLAVLVVLALIGTGAAIATGGSPTTDTVAAEVDAVQTQLLGQAFCLGQDGFYRQAVSEFRGAVTSSDPRLSGNIVAVARTLINLATGFGTEQVSAVITDPATGKVKGRPKLVGVISPGSTSNGAILGTARGAGELPGGALTGNYTAVVDPATGALHVEFGSGNTGATNGANTAVIQRGSCGLNASADEED